MNNQSFLKTNSEVNQRKVLKHSKELNEELNEELNNKMSRYGTTIDLKTNKIINQTDKYLTRDRNFKSDDINIKKYRISRINIDSRYRNINPKNIINNFIKLYSPFKFTENSNILEIKMPFNHGFNIDDNITISNLTAQNITLRSNSLSLKKNSKYIYINHEKHGFRGSNNIISISGVVNVDSSNYFFGNIPLSIINTEHKIILINSNGIVDSDNYMTELSIYSDNDFIYSDNTYEINILTINGVHIKYINASYPIINNIQQGYHTISDVSSSIIKIKLSVSATTTTTTSENKYDILIGKIESTINGYPYPDFYKYDLKKTYYKVKKIKLVSSEIPNTEMLIKNTPTSLKNNMLYWQIQDDGDFIYSINISPGNYNADSLKLELINKISNVSRKFGSYLDTKLYSEKCVPDITLNSSNNLFTIQINSIIILSKNITINKSIFTDTNKRINITHPLHNLKIGDVIKISNAINILDSINHYIPSDIINSTHIIESINGINNYTIKLVKYNSLTFINNDDAVINGGNAVMITFPLFIRLLFNYKDTIGNILGFKNINSDNSITIFDKIISNNSFYLNGSELNSIGIVDSNVPILNFNTYPYILMVSELFSSNINHKDSTGVFAKLFLTGPPGSMIYDQYIQITEVLPSAILSGINNLEFKFLTPDGIPYNFNGHDHSYTLEIYEEPD